MSKPPYTLHLAPRTMTYNRFGTILALLFTLGWLVAVGVSLSWMPQLLGQEPMFHEHGREYLPFVAENRISWAIFHIGATGGLLILLPLISHLSQLQKESPIRAAMHTIGLLGAFSGLLASLIDQFATPVLAQWQFSNPSIPFQIWEVMEPFRDDGLKTISFLLLGIWALWQAGAWLREKHQNRRLARFTQIMGVSLLILGLIELMVPLPWRNIIGETGIAGLALLLLPLWGAWVAHWFWQKELVQWNQADE